jgi:hypothetical protein
VGQLAAFDDSFLQTIGLAGPLDQFGDLFTGGFGTTGADLLTNGLTSTIDPLSFLGL